MKKSRRSYCKLNTMQSNIDFYIWTQKKRYCENNQINSAIAVTMWWLYVRATLSCDFHLQ